MVSALTVLDASENAVERVNWSYLLLADELRRWSSRPDQDRNELFLRMAFNALTSNQDDHPRNHALVSPGTEWELSPAYDLTPVPQYAQDGRQLALDCGNAGRLATRENLVSEAPRFGYSREEAGRLIDSMEQVVDARWRELVLKHGGAAADCDEVSSAFCYPGFHFTGI